MTLCVLEILHFVQDDKMDLVASGDGFADAFGQGVEGLEGVAQAAGDDAGAEDDAAVGTVVDAVAGFEHGADAGHGGGVAHEFQLLALFATGSELVRS